MILFEKHNVNIPSSKEDFLLQRLVRSYGDIKDSFLSIGLVDKDKIEKWNKNVLLYIEETDKDTKFLLKLQKDLEEIMNNEEDRPESFPTNHLKENDG